MRLTTMYRRALITGLAIALGGAILTATASTPAVGHPEAQYGRRLPIIRDLGIGPTIGTAPETLAAW